MNKKKQEAYKIFKGHIVSKTISVYQNDLNKHQNPEYVQSQTTWPCAKISLPANRVALTSVWPSDSLQLQAAYFCFQKCLLDEINDTFEYFLYDTVFWSFHLLLHNASIICFRLLFFFFCIVQRKCRIFLCLALATGCPQTVTLLLQSETCVAALKTFPRPH